MLKFRFKAVLIFFIFSASLIQVLWAQDGTKIYVFNYCEFLDESKREEVMAAFIKKYPLKRDQEGFRRAIIPILKGSKYLRPGPEDDLWVFFDSKLVGKTRVENYVLGGGGYQSNHFWFDTPKMKLPKTGDRAYHSEVMVTVPKGTAETECPKEYIPQKIKEDKIAEILRRLEQKDPNAVPTQADNHTSVSAKIAAPIPTFTPTFSPTPTFLGKIKDLLVFKALSKKDTEYLENSIGPTPLPTVTPVPWEEKIKNEREYGLELTTMDFPMEDVKFLKFNSYKAANGNGGTNKIVRSVYVLKDKIFNFSELDGSLGWCSFDQTFEINGKHYICLYGDSGESDEYRVYRIDPGALVQVASGSIAYD